MDPGFIFLDWRASKRFDLHDEVIYICALGELEFFEVLSDIFFPWSPGFEREHETACGNRLVCHIAGWFGYYSVCPGEDVVEEKFVDVDDVVAIKNSDSSILVVDFANSEFVEFGECCEHVGEVGVDASEAGELEFVGFKKWERGGEEGFYLSLICSESACSYCQPEWSVSEGCGRAVLVFFGDTGVCGATCNIDSIWFDFVAEHVGKLDKFTFCFFVEYCPCYIGIIGVSEVLWTDVGVCDNLEYRVPIF